MIVARRTPPAEMAAAHNRVAAAMAAEERGRGRGPAVANIEAAREMWTPRPLYFRGRRIAPRPIDWNEGLDLLKAALKLEEWRLERGEDLEELRALYRRIADLAWLALRAPWMPRWLRRRQRNPFRRATETELREILDFAGRCQTISLVGHRS